MFQWFITKNFILMDAGKEGYYISILYIQSDIIYPINKEGYYISNQFIYPIGILYIQSIMNIKRYE